MWEKAVCGSLNASCAEFGGVDDKLDSGKLTVNDQQRVSHGVTPQRPEGLRLGIPADRKGIISVAAAWRQWRCDFAFIGKTLIGRRLPIRVQGFNNAFEAMRLSHPHTATCVALAHPQPMPLP